DKTGTLTEGRLSISEVRNSGRLDEQAVMELASALEQHSEHPIARAFPAPRAMRTQSATVTRGGGVEGEVDGRRLRIGRPDWVAALAGQQAPAADERGAWIALGDDQGVLASFRLADQVRTDARMAVERLREQGIAVEVASGDSPGAVEAVASELGISTWQARMSPEDKLQRLRALQEQGASVLMVGDGINDAPILAGANVSAAMNEGTALAQTTAGMILLGGRLEHLAAGMETARATLRTVRQNLILSACYNASMLPLAALGFIPPWLAAIGMTASSLVVVLNSRRLAAARKRQLEPRIPATAVREGQPA
ncbi:HAD-IC family P-type ATPase, partial [Aquisalimonas sp.]